MHSAEYEFGISSSGRRWLALEFVPILLVSGVLLAAAASGAIISQLPSFRLLLAIAAAVFSYLGFLSLRASLNRGPLLRLAPEGIEERNFGFGLIPWTEILGARAVTENRRGLVCETLYLRVSDWRAYFDRLSILRRLGLPLLAFRHKLIPLELTYLDVAMDDFIEIIEAFRPGFHVD